MMTRAALRFFWMLAFICLVCAPIVAQVHPPGEPPDRPGKIPRPPRATAAPFETPTPVPLPTLPPIIQPTPGGKQTGTRMFLQVPPGRTVPLRSLPRLPFDPGGQSNTRHTMAATGATMTVVVDPGFTGLCGTTVGTIYNVGCPIGFFSQDLPTTNTYQDYYIDANAATATSIGSTYAGANTDPGWTMTLSHAGTYVLAAFNVTLGTWDAVTYITVGGATYFATYSDVALNVPSTQFQAKASNTVYINATGLTPTDSYVVYAEYTSVGATCIFSSPAQVPAAGANSLCNPGNSAGQTAPGGTLTVSWSLSNALSPGTYSIVLYDKTAAKRLAQRQISMTKNGAGPALTLTPSGGNASPAPAPAGVAGSTFAFNGSTDASDSSVAAATTGLTATHAYRYAFSDPNGTVFAWANQTSTAAGALNFSRAFAQAQSPQNYIGNTYSLAIYDTVTKATAIAMSFKIVGYNVLTQFTSPLGTSLVIPSGGSTVSGLKFTNNSETSFGTGNGDPIAKIQWNTYTTASGVNGLTITLGAGSSSCGANCQTQTVADSTGQNWVATSNCGGSGANKFCNMIIVPQTAGKSLPANATLSIPNISFNNSVGNKCSTGCAAATTMLPFDGLTWSTDGDSSSSNPVNFTNGFGTTYSATAHMVLYGERVGASGTLTVGKEAHGYTPRFNQAVYANNYPSAAPSNQNDVFALTFNNTSSGGTVKQIEITVPTAFSPASATNFVAIDPASPTSWTVSTCPSGAPPTAFCFTNSGGNAGIAAGASETIYWDINPPPANEFSFTDFSIQAVSPQSFTASADASGIATFVPSTTQVDSLAIGSYSIDSTLITPSFTPTSEGTSTNNNVTVSVQNASSTNPEYLDLIAIDLPTANTLTSITPLTAGFSLLGTSTPSAGVTRYWFGLCAAQFVVANGPPNDGIASCGSATEQSALAPGATFSFTANIQTAASNITATEYAHGATVGGWSAARTFTLTVTAVSAIAGFKSVGTYGSPTTVTSNTQPTIGSDSDPTYGNSYVYEIKNTGSNPITSATITVPGSNTGGANGADAAGQPWTITAAPTLSGSGVAGCTVSSYTSALAAGTDGSIVISGCTGMTAGKVLDISFPAKAPYNINYNYQFGTVVNGAINASEAWFSDTIMKIVLTGSISVTVNPSNPGPGGSTPVVSCPGCAFDLVLNQIQFRNIPNSTTDNYTDVMRVSVYTDAGTTNSWTLSIQASNNPATTGGTYTKELVLGVDSGNSSSGTGMVIDQSSLAVVPTATSMQLAHAPTGITPRRLPFDIIENFSISIGTEAIVPQSSVLTYTYIAN